MSDAVDGAQVGGPARYIGVGCLTAVAGFFSGAMFAVLIAKIVGGIRKCPPLPDTGAPCDWHVYAGVGGLIGMITLPAIAFWRLRAGARPTTADRG